MAMFELVSYIFGKMLSDVVNLPATFSRFEGLLFSPGLVVLIVAVGIFTLQKVKLQANRPRRQSAFWSVVSVFVAAYKKRREKKHLVAPSHFTVIQPDGTQYEFKNDV